jgi:hypothetical protein
MQEAERSHKYAKWQKNDRKEGTKKERRKKCVKPAEIDVRRRRRRRRRRKGRKRRRRRRRGGGKGIPHAQSFPE